MPACPSCHVVLNRKQTPNAFSRRGSRLGRCFLLGLALISFFCLDCRRAAPPAPAIKYNLLVISIDTCRADHLTCYGYNRSTSPHLDQLAKEGVLFENADRGLVLDGAVAHEHVHLALSQRPRGADCQQSIGRRRSDAGAVPGQKRIRDSGFCHGGRVESLLRIQPRLPIV